MTAPALCPLFWLGPTWQEALLQELKQPYMVELAAFLEREERISGRPVYPPKESIFQAFLLTPLDRVKVVLIGQDPYHGPGQAHGLSFSVPPGIKPPPSLVNIFKELEADVGVSIPSHGCLLSWAEQGVLLLNAALTVRGGEPMSHQGKGWERFTDAVVRLLAREKTKLVFVLWGKAAQEKCRFLEEYAANGHLILQASHPSPYSASQGFFGSRPFSQINAFLAKQSLPPIQWTL